MGGCRRNVSGRVGQRLLIVRYGRGHSSPDCNGSEMLGEGMEDLSILPLVLDPNIAFSLLCLFACVGFLF